jgi:hypothetical protein
MTSAIPAPISHNSTAAAAATSQSPSKQALSSSSSKYSMKAGGTSLSLPVEQFPSPFTSPHPRPSIPLSPRTTTSTSASAKPVLSPALTILETKSPTSLEPAELPPINQSAISPLAAVTASTSSKDKDKGLKSVKSIRQMALFNYARQENTYIPQEAIALALPQRPEITLNLPPNSNAALRLHGGGPMKQLSTVKDRDLANDDDSDADDSDDEVVVVTTANAPSSASTASMIHPPAATSKPTMMMMRKPTLAIAVQDDEQDWIQVAETDDDDPLAASGAVGAAGGNDPDLSHDPSPKPRASLSVNFPQQSYLFTKSGTIFVDGFMEGIRKDGIVTLTNGTGPDTLGLSLGSPGAGAAGGGIMSPDRTSSSLLAILPVGEGLTPRIAVNERLVIISKLGQGASSVVYKALDLVSMRLVALKMIPVFERGKRRQMVRELAAMFQMLRKKQEDFANKKFAGK